MFEDSLVESVGRIRTRSRRYVAGSLFLEAALVTVIALIPYIYPAALPRKYLSVPLIAPPPPVSAPAEPEHIASSPSSRPELLRNTLVAPTIIPRQPAQIVDAAPPGVDIAGNVNLGPGNGAPGAILPNAAAPPPLPHVHPPKPTGPIHVSSGVAAGQLIVPIQPHYSAIALQMHAQGTVVVSAVIGTDGRIASLRVVSGSPVLVPAAVDALRQARYRPWTLNGEPVEVETTINVVFSLGDPHMNS